MAQGAPARGEQSPAQFVVAGGAAAEDGDAGVVVDGHDPDFVGAPVADRPERVGAAPQELCAHRLHRAPLGRRRPVRTVGVVRVVDRRTRAVRAVRRSRPRSPGRCEARGDTAPAHQPSHRRLHVRFGGRHAAMTTAHGAGSGCTRAKAECAPGMGQLGRADIRPNIDRAERFGSRSGTNRNGPFSTGRRLTGRRFRLPAPSAARGEWGGGVPQPTGPGLRPRPNGPTHAVPIEALPRRPDESARPGARPHGRSTRHPDDPPRRLVTQQSRHTEQRPLTVGIRRTTLCLRMPHAYARRRGGRLCCRGVASCPGSNAGRTKSSARFSPSRESATPGSPGASTTSARNGG